MNVEALLEAAHEAGKLAVEEMEPPHGPCGFAWVGMKANTKVGRYIRKKIKEAEQYPGDQHSEWKGWDKPVTMPGVQLWVFQYGQSVVQKLTYARAYAGHLQENGVNAWSGSRMD